MKNFFSLISFISKHPLNKNRLIIAFFNFFKWQFLTLITKNRQIVNWIDNSKIVLKKGETGLTGNLYCGFMEFSDMTFLLHYLDSSDEFYDIGANVGAYTILASSVKRCSTYSFEPIADTFDRLIDQININRVQDLVKAKNCGVGAKSDVLEFTNSLNCLNKVNLDTKNKNVSKVRVISLDEEFDPKKNTVVKVDVEGYEKFVLIGGENFFKNSNVNILIIEINGNGNSYGVSNSEINSIILKFGFFPVSYDPFERKIYKMENFNNIGNTIYVKDIASAQRRCKNSKKFTVHTSGGLKL